jgi:tetratricopeptide (TPR) repeat protein
MASVIGRTFFYRVLQAVDEANQELDKRVSVLLRMEMIREAARLPEVEYAFRNPLTQEAVYQTILLKRRRDFHRRVGEAIETLYSNRLERLYSLLAHHFAMAGLREKAIEYSHKASKQAVALYAYDDAVQNLQTALKFIDPQTMADAHGMLLEEMGDIYRLLRDGENSISSYQQALELLSASTEGDSLKETRLHRKILQVIIDKKWAVSLEYLGTMEGIRQASRKILIDYVRSPMAGTASSETVHTLVALSTDAWRIENPPDWEEAQEFAQAAVHTAAQLDNPVDESQALGALGSVLDGRSLLREYLEVAHQRLALRASLSTSDFPESIELLRSVGAGHMYVGEYQQAIQYLQEAEELAVQAHMVDQEVNSIGLQAQCLFRLDRWDDMLALEGKWRDLEKRYSRERVGETCFYTALSASVFALRGQSDQANSYTDEAYNYMVAVSGEPDNWQRNQFY